MSHSNQILDHYGNSRSVGSFKKGDGTVDTDTAGAPARGDVTKLQIRVNEQGAIEDTKFKTYGCGPATASSSLVMEWVKGKTPGQVLKVRNTAIAEELVLSSVKIHYSILVEDAIKTAVTNYKEKHSSAEQKAARVGLDRRDAV